MSGKNTDAKNDKLADVAEAPSALAKHVTVIDHFAIAVIDLESSIEWYTKVLGFSIVERRTTEGKTSGMMSVVLRAGALTLVLLQGANPESQVTQFIDHYGPGVQHLALRVANIEAAVRDLTAAGLEFDTPIIGEIGLRQAFSRRDRNSGLMLEIIERENDGFDDRNVSDLFRILESKDAF